MSAGRCGAAIVVAMALSCGGAKRSQTHALGETCALDSDCAGDTGTPRCCPDVSNTANLVCVDISSDLQNCGGCGAPVCTGTCDNGFCFTGGSTGTTGTTGGGTSGGSTGSSSSSSGGPLMCPPGTGACWSNGVPGCECSGVCVFIDKDMHNCGACGVTCPGADSLVPTTNACCGGVCTDTSMDGNNCGNCGYSCQGRSCSNSYCH